MREMPSRRTCRAGRYPTKTMGAMFPPSYRMRGGRIPQGGVPGATGHAGRSGTYGSSSCVTGFPRMPFTLVVLLVIMAYATLLPRHALAQTYDVNYLNTRTMVVYYVGENGVLEQSAMPINFPDSVGNTYHCIEPHATFQNGTHSSEDASNYFTQKYITKLGMSAEWCKDTSNVPSDYSGIVEQVFMWKILHEANFGSDGVTIDFVTADYDSNAAYDRFSTWYNKKKDYYTGYGVVLTNTSNGSAQRIARFWAEETGGKLTLRKSSTNPSVTDGNACYSLKGARYGIWKDKDCTQSLGASYDLVLTKDGTSNTVVISAGTYWVKEKTAPQGYVLDSTAHKVTVQSGDNEITLHDEPLVETPDLWVTKRDIQTEAAQGQATLQDAQYTIRYYDGVYDANNLPSSPKRTWVLKSDQNGRIVPSNQSKVDGDDFYTDQDGTPLFPLGTIAIQETKAPTGYLLEGQGANSPANYTAPVHVIVVNGSGSYAPPTSSESVVRGGVSLGKISRETNDHLPQGEATLEGAIFSIVYDGGNNGAPVMVGGRTYERGSEVARISTDESGIATSDSDLLPYGTYRVKEVTPPKGYLPNANWSKSFSIMENGVIVDLSTEDDSVDDQVIRGGFHFNKTDENTMGRMAGTVFRMTSNTTGESHILVADENGIVDTEDMPHGENTNANDGVVGADGSVDEAGIIANAGVWFSGRTDVTVPPNEDLCALPYDVYTIEELPSSVNENRTLVTFSVSIHRHDLSYDMGTVDDATDDTPEPLIATTCTFDGSQHVAPVSEKVLLVDTVRYEGLISGEEYVMTGTLVQVNDGAIVGGEDDALAQGQTTFVPRTSSGTVEVSFELDSSALAGKDVVAFEKLLLNGNVVTTHEDPEDDDQTIHFPFIKTTLCDEDGNHEIDFTTTSTLVDTVSYENLIEGRSYELIGTLVDKETGDVLLNAFGSQISASTHFVAEQSGMVDVTFAVDADAIRGRHVVAFERLAQNGIDLVSHEDLEDADQTVVVPDISTSVRVGDEGRELMAQDELNVVDTVSYRGLVEGMTYHVEGSLVDRESGGVITDEQGNQIVGSATFVAESTNGSVDIPFSLNASSLAGKSVVAFERLLCEEDGEEHIVAVHEDLEAEEQTIVFPLIQTNATDAVDGDKELKASGALKVIDTVTYHNLTPGETYRMLGTMYDKETGKPLTNKDGASITAEQSFVPQETTGSVELTFSFDASLVKGKAVVAFEKCLHGDVEVATHEDLSDRSQTVFLVDRKTVKKTNKVTSKNTPKESTNETTREQARMGRSTPQTGDASVSWIVFFVLGVLTLGSSVAYIAHRKLFRP